MDPINKIKENCTPTSSNCVKWPAVELEGLSICRDSSVTEVIIALNEKLKNITDNLNIDTYELNCLGLEKCGPQEFADLVQLIINKICAIEDGGGVDLTTMKIFLSNIGCDIFPDGDYTIPEFAEKVAFQICEIKTTLITLQNNIQDLGEKINKVEGDVAVLDSTKQNNLIFEGHGNANDYLNTVTNWYEEAKKFVGDENKLKDTTINFSCNQSPKRLNGDGDIVFKGDANNFADNINHIYELLCDVRTAVKNLKQNAVVPQLNFESYLTCSYLYYKGTFKDNFGNNLQYDSTKLYGIVINGVPIQPLLSNLVLDGEWHSISKDTLSITGNIESSTDGKIDVTYTVDGKQEVLPKNITIEPAVTNYDVIVNNNIPTISFNKNINNKSISVSDSRGYSDPDITPANYQGSVTHECLALTEEYPSVTFLITVDGDNPTCYSKTVDYVYPDPIKPVIDVNSGGYDLNADDKNIINTVPNDEYNDWENILNS